MHHSTVVARTHLASTHEHSSGVVTPYTECVDIQIVHSSTVADCRRTLRVCLTPCDELLVASFREVQPDGSTRLLHREEWDARGEVLDVPEPPRRKPRTK